MALGKRELISYFLSPVGYVVGFLFIGLYSMFFFYGFAQSTDANGVLEGGAPVVGTFAILAVPFLTMGLLADEKKSGTIEMLMTAPVADWEVVLGKYIGSVVFVLVMVAPSVVQIPVVANYGRPEWGPVITGYIGLVLMVVMLVAMGLFFSSISKSALVAVMTSFVVFITILVLGGLVPESAPAIEQSNVFSNVTHYLYAFLRYASLGEHYNSFAYGLVNSRDLVYFLSGTGFFLFLSTLAVESRKWK
jgi:ABC-2 type transport system permease protein